MDNRSVTTKWVVGVLLTTVFGMSGYIFQSKDRMTDAQAAALASLHQQVSDQAVEIATVRSTNQAQYGEILRRLERIERNQDIVAGRRSPRQETP